MNIFKQILENICGGRVLDVGTQKGGFVQILIDNLKSYTEIVGIDINEDAIKKAQSTFVQEDIQFIQMDAEQLNFEDGSFDTVCISASLHHLENIQQVLMGMKRVLKTGGYFIVAEMHRNGQTEAQLTTVDLHHWAAEIDSALGIFHNNTLARQELVDYVMELELTDVDYHDFSITDSDSMNETKIAELESWIDKNILRAKEVSHYTALKLRGDRLRRQIRKVGIQKEPVVVIVGRK